MVFKHYGTVMVFVALTLGSLVDGFTTTKATLISQGNKYSEQRGVLLPPFPSSSSSSSSSLRMAGSTNNKPYSEWTAEEKKAEKEKQETLLKIKAGVLFLAAMAYLVTQQ